MNDNIGQWMSGTDANTVYQNGGSDVVNMATTIFALVGANKYAMSQRFKHDDVVVEETAFSNQALIVSAAGALLLVALIIVVWKA